MEIRFYGGNCVKIAAKKCTIVVDDDVNAGGKPISTDKDIVLRTGVLSGNDIPKSLFFIDGPGEYEVSEASIKGIAVQAHTDSKDDGKNNTMYQIVIDDVKIAVVGHIDSELSDDQLEALGMIDILIVPVGGNGLTLDGVGAAKVVRQIEPKVVIPTNYDDGKTKYEVPQTDLPTALKGLGIEPSETLEAYKFKPADISTMGESARLIILESKV